MSVPRSGSPFRSTVAKPPSDCTRRMIARRLDMRRNALGHPALRPDEYPARLLNGMCERRNVPVPRAASSPSGPTICASAIITLPPAADPPALGNCLSGTHRPGEVEVESGRQQEAVADQAVRGIEGNVVQHLEIERAMRRSGGVEGGFIDLEADPRGARAGDFDFGFELPIDGRRAIKGFETTKMRLGSRSPSDPYPQAASRSSAPMSTAASASRLRAPRIFSSVGA